jgi:hypothetical protein
MVVIYVSPSLVIYSSDKATPLGVAALVSEIKYLF